MQASLVAWSGVSLYNYLLKQVCNNILPNQAWKSNPSFLFCCVWCQHFQARTTETKQMIVKKFIQEKAPFSSAW